MAGVTAGSGIAPTLETVAGSSTVFALTAVAPDGLTPVDLTGVAVDMRVAAVVSFAAPATYSTGVAGGIVKGGVGAVGTFTIQTNPTLDAVAGFYRYAITLTTAGGVPSVLAHGVYAVASP